MAGSFAHRMAGPSVSSRNVATCAVLAPPVISRTPAMTGAVKSPMTITEKILSNHTEAHAVVKPGDNIWTKVDKLLTHDVCGPGTFGVFEQEFGANAKVCVTDGHLSLCLMNEQLFPICSVTSMPGKY